MADTRELILVRIMEICVAEATGAGILTSVRNRGLLTNEKRPAVVLLDGDETAKLVHDKQGRAGMLTPQIMIMRPELYIVLKEERSNNEEIGSELNEKRILLIKAIAEDVPLATLLGSNGGIVYNGCVTDLKSGSSVTGQMRLDFALTYTFFPTNA
jgi:hypothetical protein